MMRAFVGVLAIVSLYGQAPEKKVKLLTVCELVARRDEFNGQMVTVRGEVMSGPHGIWLAAHSDCEYRLITRGVKWENVIFLAYPDSRYVVGLHKVRFRVDWRSIQGAQRQVSLSGYDSSSDRIIQTYEGLFVTYTDLEARVNPGVPRGRKVGFGPAGLEAPAQLLIKSVMDTAVIRDANR